MDTTRTMAIANGTCVSFCHFLLKVIRTYRPTIIFIFIFTHADNSRGSKAFICVCLYICVRSSVCLSA